MPRHRGRQHEVVHAHAPVARHTHAYAMQTMRSCVGRPGPLDAIGSRALIFLRCWYALAICSRCCCWVGLVVALLSMSVRCTAGA